MNRYPTRKEKAEAATEATIKTIEAEFAKMYPPEFSPLLHAAKNQDGDPFLPQVKRMIFQLFFVAGPEEKLPDLSQVERIEKCPSWSDVFARYSRNSYLLVMGTQTFEIEVPQFWENELADAKSWLSTSAGQGTREQAKKCLQRAERMLAFAREVQARFEQS